MKVNKSTTIRWAQEIATGRWEAIGMFKLLLATIVLVTISVIPSFSEGTGALGLPAPQNTDLIREVNLNTNKLLDSFRSCNPDLVQFIKEIKEVRIATYRLHAGDTPAEVLKSYDSDLVKAGWHSMIRDQEKPGEVSAVYNQDTTGLVLICFDPKGEMSIIRVEGSFDFSAANKAKTQSSMDSSFPEMESFSSQKSSSSSYEEAQSGNPEWNEDKAAGKITGTRNYRSITIPANRSGKLTIEGFSEEPQIHQGSQNEVVIDYKKSFTGSTKQKALEMEKRCLVMVNASSDTAQVRLALVELPGSPTSEVTCKAILEITVPSGWKVDFQPKE